MTDARTTSRTHGVVLSDAALEGIRQHLNAEYPREGCGMLVGRVESSGIAFVTRAIGARNTETFRGADRFTIDARDMLSVERLLVPTRGSERIVGFFHSHPDSPARPSRTDLDMAQQAFEFAREFYVYLIGSVEACGITAVTCWQLNAAWSAFEEIPILAGEK